MLNLNYLWIMLKTVSSVTIFSGKILKKIWQPLHETKKQWVGVLLLELIVYLQNWPDMLDFSSQSSSIHSLPRPSRGHMYMSTKKKNSVSTVTQCPPVPEWNLRNTSSPPRLHPPPWSAPAHMLTVRGRIWISAVRAHCAGRATLSDLRREEIKDERSRRCGLGACGQSEEKVQCGLLPVF